MEQKLYWVWLTKIQGLGPIKIKALLGHFEDAEKIWNAGFKELKKVSGIGIKLSKNIISAKDNFSFSGERKKLKKSAIKLVTLKDKCYPKLLKEIYAPPPVLYYRGELLDSIFPCISVVGTRSCTKYGRELAYDLSQKLAEKGFVVVSGLAQGVDTKAHYGALQSGMTYAILGSGFNHLYPADNKQLAAKISQQGAVISSYYMDERPHKANFPARNRIISGLSLGTIVIEAPNKSGALITANYSLQQGREVFAVPGDIKRKESKGTNKLIQAGAKLVCEIDDILEELVLDNFSLQLKRQKNTKNKVFVNELNQAQKDVYQVLTNKEQQFEKILSNLRLEAKKLNSILSQLEIMGLIKKLPGKRFRITN